MLAHEAWLHAPRAGQKLPDSRLAVLTWVPFLSGALTQGAAANTANSARIGSTGELYVSNS